MTGYGRGVATRDGRTVSVELKSVNNRFLDVSCKLPKSLAYLEETVHRRFQVFNIFFNSVSSIIFMPSAAYGYASHAQTRRSASHDRSRGRPIVWTRSPFAKNANTIIRLLYYIIDRRLFLTYENLTESSKKVNIDKALAAEYVAAAKTLRAEFRLEDDFDVTALLRTPEVVSVSVPEDSHGVYFAHHFLRQEIEPATLRRIFFAYCSELTYMRSKSRYFLVDVGFVRKKRHFV